MKIYSDTAADIAEVAALLSAGEVVALPTETVYGLAADAMNEKAVRRIFEIKGRPLLDPLIVHIHDATQVEKLAEPCAEVTALAERFWPGPLTIVLPKKPVVLDLVTAGKPSIALRMPAHPMMREVLSLSGCPLAAPSANPFGYISPTTAQHVADSLGELAPHILDGGPCVQGLESTILSLLEPETPTLLRPGPIRKEQLEAVLGRAISIAQKGSAELIAPGMLDRHYSPRTRVVIFHDILPDADDKTAWLWQRRPSPEKAALPGTHFWLSEDGDSTTAARNLFALLRQLDVMNFHYIAAQLADESGLGLAIIDRLRRAAAE